MKSLIPFLLLALLLVPACRSGKKALEQGNYYDSVIQAVNRLRQSPGNRNASETLQQAYNQLLSYNQDQIARLTRSNDPNRWERIVDFYSQLNRAYDEIMRSPSALAVVSEPQNFAAEQHSAEVRAAEMAYATAEMEMERARIGDREAAKRAYIAYEKAERWMPGFRDARSRMDEAMDLATVFVLVEPIPMHSQTFGLTNEFFQNQILEFVRRENMSRYVRFVTSDEYISRRPDHTIQMVFDDFVVGQSVIREKVEQRSRDSVVIGEVTVKEEGVDVKKKVYGTVKAEMHRFSKELASSGLLDVRILDNRNQTLLVQRKFPGTYTWSDSWGYFNGDERALTDDDRRVIKNGSREIPNPTPQFLFVEFTKPIYTQTTRFIRNFYEPF